MPSKQHHNKQYSKDNRYLLIILMIFQLGLIAILTFMVFLQYSYKPKPVFFAVTKNKQLIEPQPLDKPYLSTPALLNWVNEAIIASYSFNYLTLSDQITILSPYFDQRGFSSYFQALKNDKFLKMVQSKKLIVSAKALAAPELIQEGLIEQRHGWLVKMQIEIRFENADNLLRENATIEVFVIRVPEIDSPLGIRITQFTVKNQIYKG